MGFRVLGFGFWVLGFRVHQGLGFRVSGLGFSLRFRFIRVSDLRFRV